MIIQMTLSYMYQQSNHINKFYLLSIQADNKEKTSSERKSIHLDALLTTVRSLGISLNVWKPKESGKKLEWTSLLGGEKRLLLRKLPCYFSKLLPPQRAPVVQQLWTVSKNNYSDTKIMFPLSSLLINKLVLILPKKHYFYQSLMILFNIFRAFRRSWT